MKDILVRTLKVSHPPFSMAIGLLLAFFSAADVQAFEPDYCTRFLIFESGSSALNKSSQDTLRRSFSKGEWCEKNVGKPVLNFVRMLVRGNAAKSEGKDVNTLSDERAEAVWRYLNSLGFPLELVELVSDGDSQPLEKVFGNPAAAGKGYVRIEMLDDLSLGFREKSKSRQ